MCRPPPRRRLRCGFTGWAVLPSRSSRMPVVMVVRDRPVAAATSDMPPRGKASASAAAHCLLIRSVIVADNRSYFSRRLATLTVVFIPPLSPPPPLCSSYFLPVPNRVSPGAYGAGEHRHPAAAHAPPDHEGGIG